MYDPSWAVPYFRTVPGSYTFTNTNPVPIVGANNNRVALYLSGGSAQSWNIYLSDDTQRDPPIWTLPANNTMAFVWVYDGALCTYSFSVAPVAPIGNGLFSWLELIYIPEGVS